MDDGRAAVVVHRVPSLRRWMVIGVGIAFAVSFQQITQPDYNTGRRATADEWLWVVLPALAIIGVVVWRMVRSRTETSGRGLTVVRVLTTDRVAWNDLAAIEVRATPNRAGFLVSARRHDRRLVRIGTVPGRKAKARERADAFASALRAEHGRHGGLTGV